MCFHIKNRKKTFSVAFIYYDHIWKYLVCCFCLSVYRSVKWMFRDVHIRAASWQNQQNDCAPSEDSDQPGHPVTLTFPCDLNYSVTRSIGHLHMTAMYNIPIRFSYYLSLYKTATCLTQTTASIFTPKILLNSQRNEPPHDKTNKMSVRPAKTQISLGIRPVWSVMAVHMKKAWVLSYPLSTQWRLWSDWADAQADLSLCWAYIHSFCWFCHVAAQMFWSEQSLQI